MGVTVVKLHGTDTANIGFLEQIACSSVPKILLGAGGAYASELKRALDILSGKEVVVLLGFQGYPTPNETNQIARIQVLADRLNQAHPNVRVGFSDHSPQDPPPLRYTLAATAIGAGAKVIEKHLTLGKVMKLEDHESALNPDEFAEFCVVMRGCADAFGGATQAEDFGMSQTEQGYRKMIRRHVVTSRDLPTGTRISPADLVLKRSSGEQVITDLELAYGKILNRTLSANSPLSPGDIE
jgi:N,N'-diacetyllegionaminate synthase